MVFSFWLALLGGLESVSYRVRNTLLYETYIFKGGSIMGKLNEFLICNGCGESMIEYYETGNIEVHHEDDRVTYKCPLCGTINKSKPLEEG